MEKKFIQSCDLGGSIYGKRNYGGKRVNPSHPRPGKKDLINVYNRFYRDQVAALYKVIREGKA